ncbi:MAG: ferrous iron transporter B [Clostridiales bacterium]|nr:ferrous iron transporter B [Clostridiales bacterium]
MAGLTAVLCGNPNVGKSTVFNALTGMHQHTGNWAGKTVESAKGTVHDEDGSWTLIDLPGAYSLQHGSPDEMVTADYLLHGEYDVAIVVCDATCLARSMVLALQTSDLCSRTVVCVNLMDEARRQGIGIDLTTLERELGLPVVGISAKEGQGIDRLKKTVRKTAHFPNQKSANEERHTVPLHQKADAIADKCLLVDEGNELKNRNQRMDRWLCSPATGIPIMLALLLVLFYLTLFGANIPSEWLSKWLFRLEDTLSQWFIQWNAPEWLTGAVVHGMYRTLAWVVAVMLPPMAIFFPLFTLLEDLGYLPRIAFNMDRCFRSCHACGKQALCMCMGLGCNAVGVTGCRIIQSPRERMIAILTNAITPCNGRLPFLITLISAFLVTGGGGWGSVLSAVVLVGLLALSVGMTLLLSLGLSKTVLRGMSSAYVLELPPFRAPKTGQVILRSVMDRTIGVLMRAVTVAAPAGLLLWILGYLKIGDTSLLQYIAHGLDPFGRVLGMDGAILLAFLLGLPANEIVLPIVLMIYLSQNQLMEPLQLMTLQTVLKTHGWSAGTALCTALFSMFHWPCGTTILTIYKETRHVGWTLLSILLPTMAGIIVCSLVAALL